MIDYVIVRQRDSQDVKKLFYDAPRSNILSTIKWVFINIECRIADAERRLTEPSRILERWSEHFSDVRSRSSTISQAAVDNIAQRPLMDELAYQPTLDETTAASRNFPVEKQQDWMR